MKPRLWVGALICLSMFIGTVAAAADKKAIPHWQQISLTDTTDFTDANGQVRQLHPQCSGGPVCTFDTATQTQVCKSGATAFSFFMREADPEKLLVVFDGGGACWNSHTCVLAPTYNQEVTQTTALLDSLKGVADINNAANPFRDWSMVFIPYCTGDIHIGSMDTAYTDILGQLAEPGGDVVIHHRGWDNFLSVLHYLQRRPHKIAQGKSRRHDQDRHQYGFDRLKNVDELLVTGSSAGAYGAVFAYPYLRQALPHGETRLFIDAGNGVVTDDFVVTAFGNAASGSAGNWGARQNLPHWIPGMSAGLDQGAEKFATGIISAIAAFYPDDAIGQYTTAWDAVQTTFLNIMQNSESPSQWGSLNPAVFCQWHYRMEGSSQTLSQRDNYRYYIAAGLDHTILANSNDNAKFYSETSAGQPLVDWLSAMLAWEPNALDLDWQNRRCDNCAAPFDPALCGM